MLQRRRITRPVEAGTLNAGVVDEIENPNPAARHQQLLHPGWLRRRRLRQPLLWRRLLQQLLRFRRSRRNSILKYLNSLPYEVNPKCDAGHYYLLNNYNPGYFGDGSNAYTDNNPANPPFTIPPTNQHSIADVLLENGVSWKYYGDQWNYYLTDKYQLNYGTVGANAIQYCNICNPFQYQTTIMGDASVRTAHLKDTIDFYADIKAALCLRSPTSSPAVGWTVIRLLRSSTCSKAS